MKDKIKETAAKLFQDKGYHKTSMREIAEALGVTKAALYYHYSNKEDLFISIINDMTETMDAFFEHLDADRPYDDILNDWIVAMIMQRRESPYRRRLIYYLMMGRYHNQVHVDLRPMMEKGIQAFRRMIGRAQAEGLIRRDLPLDFVIKYVITTVQGMLNEIEDRPLLNFDEMPDEVLSSAILSVLKGGISSQ